MTYPVVKATSLLWIQRRIRTAPSGSLQSSVLVPSTGRPTAEGRPQVGLFLLDNSHKSLPGNSQANIQKTAVVTPHPPTVCYPAPAFQSYSVSGSREDWKDWKRLPFFWKDLDTKALSHILETSRTCFLALTGLSQCYTPPPTPA